MAKHEGQENNLQQIRKFIRLTYDYFVKPSEKVVSQLQRLMQLLSVEEDLSVFEPSSLITVEFYACLEKLLAKEYVRDHIAWKVMLLMSHMVKSHVLLCTLRDDINMVPMVGEYLQTEGLSHDRYSKTLTLIQRMTHGIKVERKEAWLLQLLPHLVQTIVKSVEETGDRDQSLLCTALAALCNLCRGNTPVLHCLLQWGNPNHLLCVLLTKLRGCSQETQLLSTELWLLIVSLEPSSVDEALSLQVDRAMSLLLAVCKEGLSHSSTELVQMATDALTSLAYMDHLRPRLSKKANYIRELREILRLSECCQDSMVPYVASFLTGIVKLSVPPIADVTATVLGKAEAWMSGCSSRSWCLELLYALLTSNSSSSSLSLTNEQVYSFCSVALQVLEEDLSDAGVEQVQQVVAAVQLLQELLLRVPDLHSRMEPYRLTSGLKKLSELSAEAAQLHQHGALMSQKFLSSRTGLPQDSFFANSFTGTELSLGNGGSREHRSSRESPFSRTSNVSLLCSEAIVRILFLVKQIGKKDIQYSLLYSEILKQSSLIPHVMACQSCLSRPLVALSVELLCDPNVSSESLEVIVNMTHEQNRRCVESESLSVAHTTGDNGSGLLLENALESMHLTNGSSHHPGSEKSCNTDVLKRVDELMARLGGISEVAEMRDLPLTDLVDIYEFKLASVAHSELALQGLLSVSETKSRMLQRTLLRAEVESNRLRSMLRTKEERIQTVLGEARLMREKLAKEKVACERECSRLRGSLNSALDELAAKKKKLQSITSAFEESTAEVKSLQKSFDKEKIEKEGLQRELDGLQGTHANLQKSLAKQTQENGDLEKVIINLEQSVADRDQKIEELTKVNQTLQKMKEIIHNISAGKQPF
ncbi:Armadillo-type fold [Trinorchestia longiramus]|nr:Armadillo-type fold [Trinorchestia longiramus]